MQFLNKIFSSFFYLDLRSLALLRVCIGGLLIADLIDRGRDITAFYTDAGFLPRPSALSTFPGSWSISLHNLTGQYEGQLILFFIAGLFAVMLTIGYRTTLASIISWILLVSLDSRNFLVVFGADQVFRLVVFWGMFLPWHARFSVDAALSKKVLLPTKFTSTATMAYIIQIVLIYLFSVLHKTGSTWRIEGTAVYYSLALHSFRTPFFGETLFHLPFLLRPLTFAVFLMEALGPLLLFIPFRKNLFRFMAVFSFVLLHAGLGLSLRLGIFPWVCIIAWLALLPTGFWDIILKFLKRFNKTSLTIYYDHTCGFCYKAVRILKNFFLLPHTLMFGADSHPEIAEEMHKHNSWIIIDNAKKHHYKYDGFLALASASPILSVFAPIFSLPLIRHFGNLLYKVISSHRRNFCSIDTQEKVFNPKLSYRFWGLNLLAVFFITYIIFWNINTLSQYKNSMPEQLRPLGIVLGINQKWALFAPDPSILGGWFVIAARLKDGTYYDVYNNRPTISFDMPPQVTETYRSARWQRFLVNITAERNRKFATSYSRYVCQEWNKNHPASQQAEEIAIAYIFEKTKLNYIYEPGKSLIERQLCFDPKID